MIKDKVLFAVIFVLVMGLDVVVVKAQDPTPTKTPKPLVLFPTPDNRPICTPYITPTPTSLIPTVVIPTVAITVTGTVTGTVTVTPTTTPTPTQTPTPVPDYYLSEPIPFNASGGGWVTFDLGWYSDKQVYGEIVTINSISSNHIMKRMRYSDSNVSASWDTSDSLGAGTHCLPRIDFTRGCNETCVCGKFGMSPKWISGNNGSWNNDHLDKSTARQIVQRFMCGWSSQNNVSCSGSVRLILYGSQQVTPTPTQTPTPVPTIDCREYDDGAEPIADGGIYIEDGGCYVLVPQVSINLEWLNGLVSNVGVELGEIGIPGYEVCFDVIKTDITLMGISFDWVWRMGGFLVAAAIFFRELRS
jgi:hypothetical protein